MQSSATGLIALDIVLYLFTILLLRRGKQNNPFPLLLSYIAVLFFCLFAAWGGDYFHYIDDFHLIKMGYQVSFEPIYYSIIEYVNTPLQFRFVVWGSAILIFYLSSRLVCVDRALALFCLVLCFLPRFSYARASLAMSMLTLGSVIIGRREETHFWPFLIGIFVIVLSLSLHKSAFWGALMIIVSMLIYNKMSIKTIAVLSVFAPIIIVSATMILSRIMSLNIDVDDTILYAGQKYLSGSYVAGQRGWGQIIEETLMRLSFYSVAVLFVLSVKRKHYEEMPRHIKILSCTAFFTIILSTVFAFDLGFTTQVVYNRFLYYAQLPSAFFIAYCMKTRFASKWLKVVLFSGASAALYALSYSFYCSFFN